MKIGLLHLRKSYFVLPIVHLIVCMATQFQLLGLSNEWRWFLLIAIDFPISILAMKLSGVIGLFTSFAVLGTAWWFVLSVLFTLMYRKIANASKK